MFGDNRVTFFTADTHFCHGRIIRYAERPFGSLKEMEATIIGNHNSIVGVRDTVYILGDFCFAGRAVSQRYLDSLNGKIHLVTGNHDKSAKKASFASVSDIKVVHIDGKRLMLCHYPMRSWSAKQQGSGHLHGHSHGMMEPLGRSMDVGVDAQGFYPISWPDVKELLWR
jgi:calcineurin-like phosphoesterase family protein